MSHPFVDFEHLPQVFDGVTRHIGRTLGRNSTVHFLKSLILTWTVFIFLEILDIDWTAFTFLEILDIELDCFYIS